MDGKLANLALMKISSWHKKQGDDVVLVDLSGMEFDRIYASQVFAGGSGYDLEAKLPDEIEHCKPDYDLFNADYSMGFTSRGCVRNCKFCIVRRKEGKLQEHSPFKEFVDNRFQKIILMDNNFLASPKANENLHTIINKKWKVNFNQGLDLRLINDENAEILSRVKYYNWTFSRRLIHFAWDSMKDEDDIMVGLQTLLNYIPSHHIMVYVLVGFDTGLVQDLYRIKTLADLKVKPFVMIYNNKRDPKLRHLSRWVNKRYYEVVTWEEYLKKKISVKHVNRKS